MSKDGVNDNDWILKLSNAPNKGYITNMVLSNSAIIDSKSDNFKHLPVRFKLHFKLLKFGVIEFFCVTIDRHNNRGGAAQDRVRVDLKAFYSYLRQELRAA